MAMPNITFRCQMFRGDWDQVWSQMRMLYLMEALIRVNQTHLRQFEEFVKRGLVQYNYPSVYRSGLHYETEKGTEIWPDIPSLLMGTMGRGMYPGPWADCEDLACYRAAELRQLPFHYERAASWNKDKTEVADPRYPQPTSPGGPVPTEWPGWTKMGGGIKAKPFAKWRRGPQGNYHYHAIVFLPDGRLEDPSLVLGMGREKEFHEAGMAAKLRGGAPVIIQYAKAPDVMVVDPEKPSGYSGGIAQKLDARALALAAERSDSSGDESLELGAYLGNEIVLGDTEFDVDRLIGWSRAHKKFLPRTESTELRRLRGYANH